MKRWFTLFVGLLLPLMAFSAGEEPSALSYVFGYLLAFAVIGAFGYFILYPKWKKKQAKKKGQLGGGGQGSDRTLR